MTSAARRLRDALEPIAALAFHSRPALDAYASIGLEKFSHAYVWTRSSVLGEADASVVAAAFGVFAPDYLTHNLQVGRATASLADVRRVTDSGCAEAVRAVLSDEPVGDVVDVLYRGVDAAHTTGRALFAGHRALSRPDDVHLGLWRAATAWRELRGDSHLAACVVGGISGVQANILNELDAGYELGEYTATRRWSTASIEAGADALRGRGLIDDGCLTHDGHVFREQLEQWTDTAVAPALDAVGDDLDRVVALTDRWSQRIVDHGWFPDDQRKRDAG